MAYTVLENSIVVPFTYAVGKKSYYALLVTITGMKLKIISKESPQVYPLVSKAKSIAESLGYIIDESNPDVVIAIGGMERF